MHSSEIDFYPDDSETTKDKVRNKDNGERSRQFKREDVSKSSSKRSSQLIDAHKKGSKSDNYSDTNADVSQERKRARDDKSASSSHDTDKEFRYSESTESKEYKRRRDRSQDRQRRDLDLNERKDDRRYDDRVRRRDRSRERQRNDNWKSERHDDRHSKSDTHWRRHDRSGRDCDRRRKFSNRPERHRDCEEEPIGDRPAWATKAVIKRAEEIQQRKLLWGKHDDKKEGENGDAGKSSKVSTNSTWNSILAATSSDSKQLDKFKRLMGIKKTDEVPCEVNDVNEAQLEAERERQRALYKNLDQQYAIARSTTHLGRGQGLGFH